MSNITSAATSGKGFIGIHIGAGKYNTKKYPAFKSILDLACVEAIKILRSGGSALRAVTVATSVLEDSKLVNAGCGSNLTWEGEVECDAGLMDGSNGHFGAVGALQQVRNPIQVAYRLCQHQSRLDNGLIRPCLLVGPGALAYAREESSSEIYTSGESMICPASRRRYERNKARAIQLRQNNQGFSKVESVPTREDSDKNVPSDHIREISIQLHADPTSATSLADNASVASKRTAEKIEDGDSLTIKRKKGSSEDSDNNLTGNAKGFDIIKRKHRDSQEQEQEISLEAIEKEFDEKDRQCIRNNEETIRTKEEEFMTEKTSSTNLISGGMITGDEVGSRDKRELEMKTKDKDSTPVESDKDIENLLNEEKVSETLEDQEDVLLDTVGAVCVDMKGNLASSCSSGGIILKRSGRLGQACIRGAGCWAQNPDLKYGVAVTTSGPGEFLIQTSIAQEVARAFRQKTVPDPDKEESVSCLNPVLLEKTLREEFLESPFLRDVEFPKLAGFLLLLTSRNDGPKEFLWAHSSPSFGVAYMSTQDTRAHTRMSSLPVECVPGTTVNVESVCC